MACYLTQLPSEILHNILTYVEPRDLSVLPRACQYLNVFVKDNSALHREIYYKILDDPESKGLNWVQELQDLVKLQTICSSDHVSKAELSFVYDTVMRLLKNASHEPSQERSIRSVTYGSSRNTTILSELFVRAQVQDAFLSHSFLFDRARGGSKYLQEPPNDEQQQSAKLHCLYGVPLLKFGRTRASRMYPFACSKVYDLREYTQKTHWGPFMNDGTDRVDWEKVEAIMLVLAANIKERGLDKYPIFSNFWSTPFAGSWSKSYLPWPPVREGDAEQCAGEPDEAGDGNNDDDHDDDPDVGTSQRSEIGGAHAMRADERISETQRYQQLKLEDPYDVSGTWLRIVCFLDYNDFFSYNFPLASIPDNVPRPALDTGEATRVILMKIDVTKIEYPDGEGTMPVVHFKGFSRSLDGSWDENANSELRGTACMTPEGEVRWTTFSIFGGEERWRSESVQLGGPRASKGVAGNWFDKDFDPNGPCGPTAFWKISDHKCQSNDLQVLRDDFLSIVDGDEEPHEHEHLDDGDSMDSDHLYFPEELVIIPVTYELEPNNEDVEALDGFLTTI